MSIKGYNNLDDENRALVNVNKIMEEGLLRACESLKNQKAADQRWVAIAMTHFQEGFMALNRAVMKPRRLSDEDMKSL